MFGFAVFTYGLLASFVWSSAERNHRDARPHSPALRYAGYLVVGLSTGTAVALTGVIAASLYLGRMAI